MIEVILMDVTIGNYGENRAYNGTTVTVQFGAIQYYFSYRTLVAFHAPSTGLVVRKNDFGTTTGRHLNFIDGGAKKNRLDATTFQEKLETAIAQEHGISKRVYLTPDSVKCLVDGGSVHLDGLDILTL